MPVMKEYVENLYKHAIETLKFFDHNKKNAPKNKEKRNPNNKVERELSVSRAFLRTIGVTFEESELISAKCEPPDVIFREAKFEIMELLEPNRKRGDEWQDKAYKYEKLKEKYESMGKDGR